MRSCLHCNRSSWSPCGKDVLHNRGRHGLCRRSRRSRYAGVRWGCCRCSILLEHCGGNLPEMMSMARRCHTVCRLRCGLRGLPRCAARHQQYKFCISVWPTAPAFSRKHLEGGVAGKRRTGVHFVLEACVQAENGLSRTGPAVRNGLEVVNLRPRTGRN